jgi:hypothetical protein
MLQVRPPVDQVGDHEEARLRGDAADRVADGEARLALEGAGDGRDQTGQRGRRTQEDGAGKGLTDPGPVGEHVDGPGEFDARGQQDAATEEQDGNGDGQAVDHPGRVPARRSRQALGAAARPPNSSESGPAQRVRRAPCERPSSESG